MGQIALSRIKLKKPRKLTLENKLQVGFSSIVGMAMGVLSSFIVNATLTEISLNIFFSLVSFKKDLKYKNIEKYRKIIVC